MLDRRPSVSVAGDGIEIGRLQILMDEKRTSHIKNQILEARFDEDITLEHSGSEYPLECTAILKYQLMIIVLVGKCDTKGWKILRESLSKNQPFFAQGVPVKSVDSNSSIKSDRLTALKPGIRNSKLSNIGSAHGSKLSLKTPIKSPRTSRQNLRSS